MELHAFPVGGIGEIRPGDSLAEVILTALERQKRPLLAGDILVVTHKVVSKAEGHVVSLSNVRPSRQARRWARGYGYDPRVVELALAESKRMVRKRQGVLITETQHGLVCANSGVDLSNVDGGSSAALLPPDPDRSASELHKAIKKKTGLHIPVIVTDSFGRPWREGLTEVAIGAAGMRVFRDFCGRRDPYGYRLHSTLSLTNSLAFRALPAASFPAGQSALSADSLTSADVGRQGKSFGRRRATCFGSRQ